MASRAVRDMSDIPLLFTEGESEMGAPKKTRAELLDKFIQFVWDYQDKHNGETPKLGVIGKHVGIKGGGEGYYVSILVDDGRVNKISSNPFRLTITDHPDNKKAIERFKRIRSKIEEAEAQERERIVARQREEEGEQQRELDKSVALSMVPVPERRDVTSEYPARRSHVAVLERLTTAESRGEQAGVQSEDRLDRYTRTRSDYYAARKDIRAEMPAFLKIAEERDLVFELISRGYNVTKAR